MRPGSVAGAAHLERALHIEATEGVASGAAVVEQIGEQR